MLQGNLLITTVLRVFLITGIKRNSSNQIKSWWLGEEVPPCPCHSSSGAQAILYRTCAGNHLQEGVEALPGVGPAGGSFPHYSSAVSTGLRWRRDIPLRGARSCGQTTRATRGPAISCPDSAGSVRVGVKQRILTHN